MTDPSSEQKKVRYDRLLTDANEVFDLGWMNEELTECLVNQQYFQLGNASNFDSATSPAGTVRGTRMPSCILPRNTCWPIATP